MLTQHVLRMHEAEQEPLPSHRAATEVTPGSILSQ